MVKENKKVNKWKKLQIHMETSKKKLKDFTQSHSLNKYNKRKQ